MLACELQAAFRALELREVALDHFTPLGGYLRKANSRLNSDMSDRPLGDDHAAAVRFLEEPAGLKGNDDD
ncbi:hypothetical protein J2X34_002843 [Rhodococcus sp. BE178]